MYSFLSVLLLLPALSYCITVTYDHKYIKSKSKVELSPQLITCGLGDIVIITAPVVDTQSQHFLHKPNGDILKLTIPTSTSRLKTIDKLRSTNRTNDIEISNSAIKVSNLNDNIENDYRDNIVVKYINENVKSVHTINKSRVVNPSFRHSSNEDLVKDAEDKMKGNEFMIGPLLSEDHGNWVLSVYFKDMDDEWTELFQVITIEIVEHVPVVPKRPRLKTGDTFNLSFTYSIEHLQSCELTAPSSTFDRFFDRTRIELDKCGYVVTNVTKEDEGLWRIIGVGDIVYEGYANLKVLD